MAVCVYENNDQKRSLFFSSYRFLISSSQWRKEAIELIFLSHLFLSFCFLHYRSGNHTLARWCPCLTVVHTEYGLWFFFIHYRDARHMSACRRSRLAGHLPWQGLSFFGFNSRTLSSCCLRLVAETLELDYNWSVFTISVKQIPQFESKKRLRSKKLRKQTIPLVIYEGNCFVHSGTPVTLNISHKCDAFVLHNFCRDFLENFSIRFFWGNVLYRLVRFHDQF